MCVGQREFYHWVADQPPRGPIRDASVRSVPRGVSSTASSVESFLHVPLSGQAPAAGLEEGAGSVSPPAGQREEAAADGVGE